MRYFVKLSFLGTRFYGWQFQPNARTVQEELEKSFTILVKENIQLTGAGRTDSGVHASIFYAHFDIVNQIESPKILVNKLNSFLDKDIVIHDIYKVPEDLHARFSALSRTYQYRVHLYKNPFISEFSYRLYHIPDFELMNSAAAILFEYDDFTSFSKLHTDNKTNICKIMQCEWIKTDDGYVLIIKADRFLRNMVRAITGTLLDIGNHKINSSEFRQIIEGKNRGNAGRSVPAHALFLVDICYPK
jgi:tRNA pseudouridine38-40 synthase